MGMTTKKTSGQQLELKLPKPKPTFPKAIRPHGPIKKGGDPISRFRK
jgi:hypothetical protein